MYLENRILKIILKYQRLKSWFEKINRIEEDKREDIQNKQKKWRFQIEKAYNAMYVLKNKHNRTQHSETTFPHDIGSANIIR